MEIFNYKKINQSEYLNKDPFPHIELDNLWNESLLDQCRKDVINFSNWEGEKNFFAAKSKKYTRKYNDFPNSVKKIIDEMNSQKFIKWLESFTNEKELKIDPTFSKGIFTGGGIQSIEKGGFLKIHADPHWNQNIKLYRRLNMLVYLNKNWEDKWGGHLELWNKEMKECEKKIPPLFNKIVLFTIDDFHYHGHPDPLDCPEGISRDIIFTYYYSPIKPKKDFSYKESDNYNAKYQQRYVGDFKKGSFLNRILKKIK